MNLANKHANSFPVNIFIAGDYDKAVISVREYCEAIGYCVTVTKTIYVYTGGEEEGVIIGLINYPRFPTGPNEILDHALALGQKLLVDLDQETFSIQNHRNTAWYSRRPLDLAPPVVVPPVPEPVVEPIAEVVVEPVPEAPVEVSTGRKKKKTKTKVNKNNTSVVEVVESIVEVVEASSEVVETVAEVVEEPTEVVEPVAEVVEAPVEVKSFNKRQLKKTKGNKISVIETVEPIVEVVELPVELPVEVVEPIVEVVESIMELAVDPIVEEVAIQAEVVSHKDRWTKKSKGNKNGTKSSKRR